MNTAGLDPSSRAEAASAANTDPFPPVGGRGQKLDLVLHLLANLHQPIMLLGPNGAGKTALLGQIRVHAHDSWKVCYISATANLSLEHILDEMIQVLRRPGQRVSAHEAESWLEEQLAAFSRLDQSLVLLLDDAGMLMPGLLAALCRFAHQHSALRLAFALRPEDLQVKTTTDAPAVGDSHAVHLFSATEPEFDNSPAIRPSHRLPGPVFSNMPKFAAVIGILVAILVASAVGLFLWRDEGEPRSTATAELAKAPEAGGTPSPSGAEESSQPTLLTRSSVNGGESAVPAVPPPVGEGAELNSKASSSPVMGKTETAPSTPAPAVESPIRPNEQPAAEVPQAKMAQPESPAQSQASSQPESDKAAAAIQPATVEEQWPPTPDQNPGATQESKGSVETPEMQKEEPESPAAARPEGQLIRGVRDADWLMQQDPSAYTLQVVALSQLEALAKFIERIPSGDELATFRSRKGTGNLYQLFYGIYPSLTAAKANSDGWPPALGKPYPRQLKSIQQEIRRVPSRKTSPTTPSR